MKQVILRQGHVDVDEVPAPHAEPGTVLVRVQRSCISVGTELSGLKAGGLPLWKRALQQPANVQKVVQSAVAIGPKRTWSMVQGQLAAGNATGYSAAGTVIATGNGVDDLRVGDRVACAGAQSAHHAEVIRVPRNLTVAIPGNIPFNDACTVTLGAIALQGVRRAVPTLGETFVVIGMGILGQITAQLLRANGCQVIGTDLDRDRLARALELGMDLAVDPDDPHARGRGTGCVRGVGSQERPRPLLRPAVSRGRKVSLARIVSMSRSLVLRALIPLGAALLLSACSITTTPPGTSPRTLRNDAI